MCCTLYNVCCVMFTSNYLSPHCVCVCVCVTRREGGALTPAEEVSFQQLVRVTVHHLLPHVCKCFSSLFTKPPLTALTLTTTLTSHPHSSHSPPSEWAELDATTIASPLRSLCPEVFEELELPEDHVTDHMTDHVTELQGHVTSGDTVTHDHVTEQESHLTRKDTSEDHVTTNGDHVTSAGDHMTKPHMSSSSQSPPPPPHSPPPSTLTHSPTPATDTV